MTYDKCLKCGQSKNSGDTECYTCGVIYAKSEAVHDRRQTALTAKTDPPSRIKFSYINAQEERSTRTINNACWFSYRNATYFYGFCELRKGQRTFKSTRLAGDIIDMDTGAIIKVGDLVKTDPPNDFGSIRNKNLINCPACYHSISRNAESCPKCGEPINSTDGVPRETSCLPGCGAIFLFSLAVAFLMSMCDGGTP